MMIDIEEILSKYEMDVLKNLNKENIYKIIDFLTKNSCDFIDELLEDYLDLFIFEYNDFVIKFNILNKKYNNQFLEKAKMNMNILEEFYSC